MDYQSIFERVEAKYIINKSQQEKLLDRITSLIEYDEFPHSEISSVYFDTDDYRLISASLEKPAYREKLRLRSYGLKDGNSEVFLELKKKYLGVTYKRRKAMRYFEALDLVKEGIKPDDDQITNELAYMFQRYPDLKERVLICYSRDSYVGKNDSNLRVTFDYDVRYSLNDPSLQNSKPESVLSDDDMIIMEIKTLNAMPLWLSHVLDEFRIFPGNYSKYGKIYETKIMKGETECLNSYSHQYTAEVLPLRYLSSARLHQ